MMFVKKYVGNVYVGSYGGMSESGFSVFRELCTDGFLVVGDSVDFVVICSHVVC